MVKGGLGQALECRGGEGQCRLLGSICYRNTFPVVNLHLRRVRIKHPLLHVKVVALGSKAVY